MFSLYLEDLELYLQGNVNSGLHIDDIVLILLLFADDMIILGNTINNLQSSLDLLNSYCKKWSLAVNATKTKVMVFRKRGRLLPDEVFTYDGKVLDNVDNFNYLGTIFNYTGSFVHNQEHLVGKALKALNMLRVNCKKFKLKPKVLCQLFDAFVGSILGYAAEIWGYSKSKEIERIHLKFCKSLLNVRTTTATAGVYGELGRYPLYITRYVRILSYWYKLMKTDNVILRTIYKMCWQECESGRKCWLTNIKNMLCEHGFAYIWEMQNTLADRNFINLIKQRLIDIFLQSWYADKANSEVLDMYNNVKTTFGYEPYLDILPNDLRVYISRIRISAHSLAIQTGRYGRHRIPRDERYCFHCKSKDIEDEFHFIIICPCYETLRRKYITEYYYKRPSMAKFIELLQSDNNKCLLNLSIYIKNALSIRMNLTYIT